MTRFAATVLSGVGLLSALSLQAVAQNNTEGADRATRTPAMEAHIAAAPALRTVHLTGTEGIALDARLSEPAWVNAPAATRFTDSDPIDGAEPSERTTVRVLYDQDAIYIGARMHTVHTTVSSRLGRRDSDLNDSDWFIVVFDSYHDHQGGYRFRINPAGVKGDEANGDRSWDPVWEAATAVDDSGWTAELRIPFSQLRFSGASSQVWGLQFYRDIARTVEKMMFSYTPKSEKGGSARFGHLLGLEEIVPGHRLEMLPYGAARAEYRPLTSSSDASFANPFRSGRDYYRSYGLDLKYRPTPNFTLDVTMNPDFGQIEADESQVNLSANETFFGEKRPFFIEGANIFRTGGNDLLYTRRIGRAPQGSVPSASKYADIPDATTILGAAKLTGRTESGWSIGLLNAVVDRELVPWADEGRARHYAELEPLTNYFVGRAKRDFRGGASSFGGIVTQVSRDLRDSSLAERLRSSATVAGIDFRHETMDRAWALNGQLVASTVHGSPSAMIATQRSSLRYFQRPDDGQPVDSAMRSMQGARFALGLNKNAGLHWRGWVNVNATSPGFETNDLAFQTSADRATMNGSVEYQENRPGRVFRWWELRAQPDYGFNYARDRVQTGLKLEAEGALLNYWHSRVMWDHDWSRFDDRFTRGGPVAVDPGQTTVQLNIDSNGQLPYTMNGNVNHRWTPAGSWSTSGGVRFGFKPAGTWSGEVEPRLSRSHGAAQYLGTVTDSFAVGTFGRRYLFAPIDQTTASLTTRVNLTLSPTLTVALVAQPFLASGEYGDAAELARPRSYDFRTFGRDSGSVTLSDDGTRTIDPDGVGPAPAFSVGDPNFNTRTVNGTAAIRWEWRPGSSAYLVWQHRRSAPGRLGDFSFSRDRAALWSAMPENTLMVKVSYWVSP